MLGRAVIGVLLLCCGAAWAPARLVAQEPDSASHARPACDLSGADCAAGSRPGEVRVVPSRPTEFADGHEDQSAPILAGLALLAIGGLVVSILNRMALDDG